MPNVKENVLWFQYPSVWIRNLYRWVVHWAETPYGVLALFFIAVIESSVFPIPPDVLLIVLAFSIPHRAFYYALICSAGSVLGGVLGYLIGYFLWEAVGPFFLTYVFSEELFHLVQKKYEMHSFWIVFAAAFTPIPYKIFTISAGVFNISFAGFLVASSIGRSLRFFLVAGIFYLFGQKAKRFIEKYFDWLAIVFTVLLILGFVMVKKMI
jgi:membrane protein YqaA with SNARE-associated domain